MTTDAHDSLNFQNPVVLIGPANPDLQLIRRLIGQGFASIAADGGANSLRENKIIPNAIIGDLDSMKELEYWKKTTQIVRITEQNSTDFEKCIYSTRARSYVATGFAANRLDHTLSCLHVMAKYYKKKRIYLVDDTTCSFVVSGEYSIDLKIGETVSIYPLARIQFAASSGLEYALDGLHLEVGTFVGTSNKAASENIQITPSSEDLSTPYLVTLPRAYLFSLPGIERQL